MRASGLLGAVLAVCLGGCEGLRSETQTPGDLDAGRADRSSVVDALTGRDGGRDGNATFTDGGVDAGGGNDVVAGEDASFVSSLDLAFEPDAGEPVGDDQDAAAEVAPAPADLGPETDPLATPVMIVLAPADEVRMVDERVSFTATLAASDGSARDIGALVTWESSRPEVATVDGNGVVVAMTVGTTEISARLGPLRGVTTFTVAAPAIKTVAITPKAATIAAGQTQPFAATVVFSNGETFDVTGAVVWMSSRQDVAAVSLVPATAGIAVAKAPGQTEIGFRLLGFDARAVLTVTASDSGF